MRLICSPIDQNRKLKLAEGLKPSDAKAALEAGAEIVKVSVADVVENSAKKHPRKMLAASIDYEVHKATTGQYAYLGWRKTAMRVKQTKKRLAAGEGNRAYAGKYKDANGREREVTTVADYGGILEYSGKRQLRHFGPGFEKSQDAASDAVESAINAMIDKAIK